MYVKISIYFKTANDLCFLCLMPNKKFLILYFIIIRYPINCARFWFEYFQIAINSIRFTRLALSLSLSLSLIFIHDSINWFNTECPQKQDRICVYVSLDNVGERYTRLIYKHYLVTQFNETIYFIVQGRWLTKKIK